MVAAAGVSSDANLDVDIQPVLSLALERPTISFGNASSGDTPAADLRARHRREQQRCGLRAHRRTARRSPRPTCRSASRAPHPQAARSVRRWSAALARRFRSRRRPTCWSARPPRGADQAVTSGRRRSASPGRSRSSRRATTRPRSRTRSSAGDAQPSRSPRSWPPPPVAGAARPPVALIASPAHVALAGSARAPVAVTNSGTDPVVVDVARAGFALDLRGRPRVAARRSSWLVVAPRQLSLAPGATAALTVSSHVPPGAEPGDHSELVLLTTRSPTARGLPVRVRLGVVVAVRAPGKVVRKIAVVRIHVRRVRASDGCSGSCSPTGATSPRRSAATARWSGSTAAARILARLRASERRILPHSAGLVELTYRGSCARPRPGPDRCRRRGPTVRGSGRGSLP